MALQINHTSPPYSEEARQDALFHYTTATGLIGILQSRQLWHTAYFCANDESELVTGKGILEPIFRYHTHELIKKNDRLFRIFSGRGVHISHYADGFENHLTHFALGSLCPYITCFCKPTSSEDFGHGLLSQWRGYGADGGYALQFSRRKILAEIERVNKANETNYQLLDVHYNQDNSLRDEVMKHKEAFLKTYIEHLEELAQPLDSSRRTMKNPIANLLGGPLESFLDYLIHTKNQHFGEERECRLSILGMLRPSETTLTADYFNRSGLIVPYLKSPKHSFDILGCIGEIIVGPAPRIESRFKSVAQMIARMGLKMHVRPSHIPYSRI
jgi:hypothetical protein